MNYTPEQYKMLERFEPGLVYTDLTEEEMQIFWFLDKNGLLQSRSDMTDGLFYLSETGKIALYQHRSTISKAEQDARDSAKKEAEKHKQQRFSNQIAVANLAVSLASFFVGLIVEFHVGIYARVVEWWPKLQAWLSSLFH